MIGSAAKARIEAYKHLVNDSSEVDALLHRLSEKWIEEATENGTAFSDSGEDVTEDRMFGLNVDFDYLSPADLKRYHIVAAALPLQDGTDGQETSQIKSLHQLQMAVLRLHPSMPDICAARGKALRRCLLHFDSAAPPTSSPVCPTLAAVQDSVNSGLLSFTVHAPDGFDFSAEFRHVYDSQNMTSKSSYGDFIAVCKRALVVTDPTLAEDKAEAFAQHILRMAQWEHTIAHETAQQTLTSSLPHLKAFVSSKNQTTVYSNVKVIIGQDSSTPVSSSGAILRTGATDSGPSLCFWLRVCPRIEPAAFPRGTPQTTIVMERKAEHSMHFVYHRRFPLTQKVVDEFKREHDRHDARRSGALLPPPPPTVPPSSRHFNLALACSQQPPEGAESEVGWIDEDEEDYGGVDNLDDGRSVMSGDTGIHTHQTTFTQRTTMSHLSAVSAQTAASSTACFVLKAPSQCAELLGWGQNIFSSLGIDDEGVKGGSSGNEAAGDINNQHGLFYQPRPIPIPTSLAMERIKMIACSPRHTMLLTVIGNIYCCGENSEGALGQGDLRPRHNVTLLSWPVDPNLPNAPPPRIVKIAAGSGSIGSHSMAIDSEGHLFGWGVPYAVGLGGVKPVMSPQLIDTFPRGNLEDNNEGEETNPEQVTRNEDDPSVFVAARCKDIACGGGFTVAVLISGEVYSWGSFLFGKLGTGPTPTIYSARRGRSGGAKLARYQMRPSKVWGISRAESVSCGEAHALCLVQSGRVYAWGQNSCGQLGVGLTPSGFLRNSSRPLSVLPFSGASPVVRGRTVCCGAYHSVAVDIVGKVWTWGARGSACLGHNDPVVEGEWGRKINSLFTSSTTGRQVFVPYELQSWCRRWAVPRVVPLMAPIDAAQVSAGDLHTAIVSTRGHLYIWGSGAVSPPLASATLRVEEGRLADAEEEWGVPMDEDSDDGGDESVPISSMLPGLGISGAENTATAKSQQDKAKRRLRRAERVLSRATIVCTPRRPTASWLPGLAAKRTLLVSSSGGRCFVLQDEETVAAALTSPLLRKTIMGAAAASSSEFGDAAEVAEGGRMHNGDSLAADVMADDDASLDSFVYRSEDGSVGSYFAQRGKADCIVIASGKVLLAHRALLAARSSELRDMIYQEMPTEDVGGSGGVQPTQLLLPELRADSAKALLAFLYTDVLPQNCIGNMTLLRALVRVGKTLKLPRLQVICERLLAALAIAEQATDRSAELLRTKVGQQAALLGLELPPPTLSRDLGSLVGDPEFADVRFIAEGRALPAHRFLLEMRCDYFRAMFRSGMSESDGGGMVDVVVPDTFVGFLRLLLFIYTDTLPDGSDGALLEDLMSADRYNIPDMKRVCESMLVPSTNNWLDLLHAADIVNSATLRSSVEGFLRDNFSALSISHPALEEGKSTMELLEEEFPGTLERIFHGRRVAYPNPPSHMLTQRVIANAETRERSNLHNRPFPIWAVLLIAIGLLLYGQVYYILDMGWTVPIINSVILTAVMLYLFRGVVLGRTA